MSLSFFLVSFGVSPMPICDLKYLATKVFQFRGMVCVWVYSVVISKHQNQISGLCIFKAICHRKFRFCLSMSCITLYTIIRKKTLTTLLWTTQPEMSIYWNDHNITSIVGTSWVSVALVYSGSRKSYNPVEKWGKRLLSGQVTVGMSKTVVLWQIELNQYASV